MSESQFKKHVQQPLNERTGKFRNKENYNSPENIHRRERDRIASVKRYNKNDIESMKTKKKHP